MNNQTKLKLFQDISEDGYCIKKLRDGRTYHFYASESPYIWHDENGDTIYDPLPIYTRVFIMSAKGRGCNDILSEEEYRMSERYLRQGFSDEDTIDLHGLFDWLDENLF